MLAREITFAVLAIVVFLALYGALKLVFGNSPPEFRDADLSVFPFLGTN